jgi:hypothetical protein
MTTKTRLQKAEQAYRQRHGETIRVFVIFPDCVMHNGAKMTRAEFDALPKGDNDTVINVYYEDKGEKVTDIGSSRGGAVKRYIGVSPLDWDSPERMPE